MGTKTRPGSFSTIIFSSLEEEKNLGEEGGEEGGQGDKEGERSEEEVEGEEGEVFEGREAADDGEYEKAAPPPLRRRP